MSMFDMYKVKKKRPVDPNAPPRPNLLSHEKVLKDTKVTIESQSHEIRQLKQRMHELEMKIINQTAYLNELHSHMMRRTKGT
jgi:predicted RNase H-like nuclease (RuvC/YqgF family)